MQITFFALRVEDLENLDNGLQMARYLDKRKASNMVVKRAGWVTYLSVVKATMVRMEA